MLNATVNSPAPASIDEDGAPFIEPPQDERRSEFRSPHVRRELGVWLRALSSYSDLRNHPLSESERAAICSRDFTPEARIMRQTLAETLRLVHAALQRSDTFASSNDSRALGFDVKNSSSGDAQGDANACELLALHERSLHERLTDALALCESLTLTASGALGISGWRSLARVVEMQCGLRDQKSGEGSFGFYEANGGVCDAYLRQYVELPKPLRSLINCAQPSSFGANVTKIFRVFYALLDALRIVGRALDADAPLKTSLPVFACVRRDARSLINFIEMRLLQGERVGDSFADALDATAYAVGMELNKVFAHELLDACATRHVPTLYAKIENAHGLLRDCFQQSIVTLAQVFEPTFSAATLFDSFNSRLENSLALRQELWSLLSIVRRAEESREEQPKSALLIALRDFQQDTMRHLMYKDWEAFERFAEELIAARGASEATPVLHRFGAYLETLFRQVNMRAVLADHPFQS